MTILNYFRGSPRSAQKEILHELERNWTKYDVFVVQAPVATGKSRIAVALSDWIADQGRSSAILTPNNILANQYHEEFGDLDLLHKRSSYRNDSLFAKARLAYTESDQALSNYWIPLAHKTTKDVFIYDEAHNLIDQGGTPLKLWQHLFHWPDNIQDIADLQDWAEDAEYDSNARNTTIQKLRQILNSEDNDAVYEYDVEEYRGRPQKVLKVTPLSCRGDKPIFWPKRVKKLVLLSATINEYDIYNLGLDKKRVCYIACDSEIPAANRPVIPLDVAPISYHTYEETLPKIVNQIKKLLDEHPTKGIIHCTYELASRLRQHLGDHPRLHWHAASDRNATYRRFVDGQLGEGAVLMACGMSEGIDLKYNKARWQVITKVPYRSLADSKVRENCKKHPHLYGWWAVRTMMQSTGRVCRSADDYGVTYILDSNFRRLLAEHRDLWPAYYLHSIVDRRV